MEKLLSAVLAGVVFAACGTMNGGESRTVKPLPSGIDVNNLRDTTVAASLSDSCFNWNDGKLTLTIYAETLYDSAQVCGMKVGDTLVYEGKPMPVKDVKDEKNTKSVNGGLDEGGVWLQVSKKSGVYRAFEFNDHSVYTKLGVATLPLAQDFTIVNCQDDPNAPSDTIRTGQRQYVEELRKKGQLNGFFSLNTRVRIENGKIVNITRFWIP